MEVITLLFMIVQIALLGGVVFFNVAATRNWEASLARRTGRRQTQSTGNSTASKEAPRTALESSTPIRRAA